MPINTPTGYLDITNATLRSSKIVTTGFVGIANANPTNHLSIGSNLHINDTHSNVLQISGNINAASVVLGGISIAPTFDLEVVTNTGNTTPYTVEFNNAATAFVTTANATIGDTLTASKLVGDGSGISAIQSSNVTDFASNVSRITTLETDLGNNSARITNLSSNLSDNSDRITTLETDLGNNSARITNLSSNLSDNSARITNLSSNLSDNSARITNLSSNLSDNSSRITALESGDISISGDKTFTGDIIFESNVHMNSGNVFVANTVNLTVSDPIIELGSNNIGANDLGIIMTRPNNNSNVAVVFDESVDILRMGYTLNGASDSIVDLDSNALAVSVQGALSAASVSGDGSGLTSLNASNITTGALSTTSVTIDDYLIHDGDTDTKVGFPLADTFTVTTANSERLRVDSSGNVGIGTDSPAYTLDVHGTANVGALTATLTYSNAASNIVTWNSSTNEIIDSGLEKGFTEHPVVPMTDYVTKSEFGTYEASASSYDSSFSLYPWEAFDRDTATRWTISTSDDNYNVSTGEWDQTAIDASPNVFTSDVGGTRYAGHWLQIKLPNAVTLSHSNIYPYTTARAPVDGVILGSNDGEHWYKLTEFSGKTYSASTWTRIDVNATTPYQYFRMCVTKNGGDAKVECQEWRLFAEKDVTKMENLHISGDLSSETLQTGYIKWPRKPLKANESEGYVASASSSLGFAQYVLFNERLVGLNTEYWSTSQTYNTSTGAHDNTVSTTDVNGATHYGEWAQIQLPQKIALSFFKVYPRAYNAGTWVLERSPNSGSVLGSDDGVNWYLVNKFSGITYTLESTKSGEKIDIQSSKSYKYYRFVFTSVQAGGGAGDRIDMMELQLFEAATGVGAPPTSAKLQVHGSLGLAKGSALYAGDSVVAEFPKHDRPLTKYPEVAMTASTVGGYTVSEPTNTFHSNSAFRLHQAFDDSITSNWETFGGSYDTSTRDPQTSGSYVVTTVASGTTYYGVYAQMLAPFGVKVSHVDIRPQNTYGLERLPGIAVFVGSNDGTTWTLIRSVTNNSGALNAYTRYNVNATRAYKYIRIIWNKLTTAGTTTSFRDRAAASEIKIFGTEEGDESVDVVHRSVPNKPGQQQLAVYWDANDSNSYSFADSDAVYDLSGNGVTGAIAGTNGFDTEYNAWVFDGSGDYIDGTLDNPSGDWVHSTSFWYRQDSVVTANWDYLYHIGTATNGGGSLFAFYHTGLLAFSNYSLASVRRTFTPTIGQWYHFTVIYSGGGVTPENVSVYLDAKLLLSTYNQGNGSSLSLSANTNIRLGADNSVSAGSATHGSIANFRLFSKALSADQVRELYEYDAERFGHRTNVVALHKGNLGVGVTHPTARLEVAGADGLQEYPPRVISVFDYHTYIEDHGNFNFYSSQSGTNYFNYSSWNFTRAFANGITDRSTAWHGDSWVTSSPGLYQAVAVYAPAVTSGGGVRKSTLKDGSVFFGEWIEMHSPSAINITNVVTNARQNYGKSRGIGKFVILGSNDGHSWEQAGYGAVEPHDNSSSTDAGGYGVKNDEKATKVSTNSNGRFYTHHRLVVTHIMGSRAATNHPQYSSVASEIVNVAYLRFLGTPAPSSLEDGHLTLGKALTVPRFSGHAAGAETPRAESLVVHYDTTVDSVASGSTVVDTSGNGLNGIFYNNTSYSSSDRALVFDGTDDYIKVNNTGVSGDYVHSISFWIYNNNHATNPFWIGENIDGKRINIYLPTSGIDYSFRGDTVSTTSLPPINRWWHLAVTYNGTQGITGRKIYIDGVEQTTVHTGTAAALNITDGVMYLGTNFQQGSDLDGKMSKVKIWNVALTADEVAAEYALGRTGKALNITDTAVCLGGTVPRAQLDVRGSARFDGNVGIGTANPTLTLDIHSGVTRIGRRLPTGSVHDADKRDTIYMGRWDGPTLTEFTGMACQVGSYSDMGYGNCGNQASIKFFTWGCNYSSSRSVFEIRGSGESYTSGTLVSSDDRLKTSEEYIENALDTILKLKPQKYIKHNFDYIEVTEDEYSNVVDGNVFVEKSNLYVNVNDLIYHSPTNTWYKQTLSNGGIEEAGIMVQDVWYDAPELRYLVSPSTDANIKEIRDEIFTDPQEDPDYSDWGKESAHLNYTSLIPYLIKSIQELHDENKSLKRRIETLEN